MSEEKKVGYMWRIGATTADGIQTDITGNFSLGASDDEINGVLDRFHHIFSRQRARTTLVGEEDTLRKEKSTLQELREQLRVASEKESPKSAEKHQVEMLRRNITELESRISNREQGIESLKALIDPAP